MTLNFIHFQKPGRKHKPTDVFDFPDNSDISSISRLGENEKDEEPYETFGQYFIFFNFLLKYG